jgi:predicted ester cyclase
MTTPDPVEPGDISSGATRTEQHDTVLLNTQTPVERRAFSGAKPGNLAAPGRTYTMLGFDDWTDIVDYIVRSTYRIWDLKDIGLIYRMYTPTTVVHTSDGDTYGRDTVIANSHTKMAGFPDIRDFIEDVVWTGNDQDGYRTSMRWIWTAHNTGYSIYGPPTGKRVMVSGIANCTVKGENIIEEWVAYNEMSLIRQLGLDVNDVLNHQMSAAWGKLPKIVAAGESERVKGQETPEPYPPKVGQEFDIEDLVRRSFHEIWNWRSFNKIDEYYVDNYLCHGASDHEMYGLGDFRQDILARLAAFPDAVMHIDDLFWLDDGNGRYRTAVLWTLLGTHRGPGIYGPPTGKRVRMMGITNHIVQDGKFVEEWTEWGEFNLLKQLWSPGRERFTAF